MIKECDEEAQIPQELITGKLRSVGAIRSNRFFFLFDDEPVNHFLLLLIEVKSIGSFFDDLTCKLNALVI